MSFCIKKYLVFSLRKSNNTKYYRTTILGTKQKLVWCLFVSHAFLQFISVNADVT